MAARVWHEIDDNLAISAQKAIDQAKKGGDVEAAKVYALLSLASAVRLVAEAISEHSET